MLEQARELDRRLMLRALAARSPMLDPLLVRLTRAANYSRLWLAFAALLALLGGARGRRAARRGVWSVVLAALAANGPAKLIVRRRRPVGGSLTTLIRVPRSTSFPSGHSASAFAFATGACSEMPALGPLLLPLASAVAYSRVHTGVHYPSDVAAGSAIGIASGALVAAASSRRGEA
jgi:membrane-associated phospholipid phosphatase